MRLKKLVLSGFKSFADKTEFVFDSPIVGIVGPNGCGKSNVVDAFKWVLGEQSAKSLRGDAMLDVIFNGSSVRKPAGMAEVVLVFDNPRRDDGTRMLHVETDEVSVGRRLFRDGTSEYQVNNAPARLKDIREMFLDTGVGVDAYSVIEQGRVAALLEANPAERRLIFEEAAGISKFKAKKKEAQRKLEKVDQNLLRVNDIVEEVDRRLRSVKLQAGKARSYQEYTTRLRELRLGYSLQEYHTFAAELRTLEAKQREGQLLIDEVSRTLQQAQNELALNRQEFDELSQQKQQAQHALVQARADVQSARQRQQFAAQQLEQIADQLEQVERDRAANEQRTAEIAEDLARQNENLEQYTAELEEHRQFIAERQEQYREGQHQLNQVVQEIDRTKNAVLDLMRKLAGINSRLGAIEIERKNIAAQQERLAGRRQTVMEELERLDAARADLEQRLEAAKAHIAEQQQALEDKRAEAKALGQQIGQISEQLGAAREHRSGLVSRQKLLRDLEAKREGVSEGVKSVLRQREARFPFVRGLVADLLRVDVEHAHAIEAALDGRDQLLVADSLDAVVAAREAFEELEGRVNVLVYDRARGAGVLPVSDGSHGDRAGWSDPGASTPGQDDHVTGDELVSGFIGPQTLHGLVAHPAEMAAASAFAACFGHDWNVHPHRVRLALDLVRVDPEDRPIAVHLLGRTVVVDDLAVAADLFHSGPAGWRYVTKAGEVLEADGTFRAGPLTAAMGLLSRRSELEAIGHQIAEVDARIAELTHALTAGNAAAKGLEESQNALRTAIYQANETKVELSSQITQTSDRRNALQREQPVLERELEQFLGQVQRLSDEQERATRSRGEVETEQAARQARIDELVEEQRTLDESLRMWNEELTARRVQLGQVQEKQLSAQQAVSRLTAAREELAEQSRRIEQSAATAASRRAQAEEDMIAAKEKEEQLGVRQEELAGAVEELEQRVADVAQVVRKLTAAVEEKREGHAEIEEDLHRVQVKVGELRVRLEGLVQRTTDELQLDLPARYAEACMAQATARARAEMEAEARTRAFWLADESADPGAAGLFAAPAGDDKHEAAEAVAEATWGEATEGEPIEPAVAEEGEDEPAEGVAAESVQSERADLAGVAEAALSGDSAPAAPEPAAAETIEIEPISLEEAMHAYEPEDLDWESVAEEIKELKEKVHRLGNVNVDAIAEQDELEQRSTFYANQVTDLNESKRQLTELIDTINAESSVRFAQTFDAVREHFQGMFRKIFGGGSADIVLETEVEEKQKREVTLEDGSVRMVEEMVTKRVDVLEAGIEIIARPPGKKPVSISQLSGGEKAMTCISLLMSIFKSKPSPFCILDEVDAPLDEANNQRFGLIVQEFLETSQFIIITHHKRTMQIADVLYGVTMQEQGVSKRVAVKFDQVDNQGRISEHAAA